MCSPQSPAEALPVTTSNQQNQQQRRRSDDHATKIENQRSRRTKEKARKETSIKKRRHFTDPEISEQTNKSISKWKRNKSEVDIQTNKNIKQASNQTMAAATTKQQQQQPRWLDLHLNKTCLGFTWFLLLRFYLCRRGSKGRPDTWQEKMVELRSVAPWCLPLVVVEISFLLLHLWVQICANAYGHLCI